MSILNGGSFVGSALGAGLTAYLGVSSTDFSNLFLLVLLCNFSTLLPAPFLGLLPASLDQDSVVDVQAGTSGDASSSSSSRQHGSGDSMNGLQLPVVVQPETNGVSHARRENTEGDSGRGNVGQQDVPLKSGRGEHE